jgi:hypothetical protein
VQIKAKSNMWFIENYSVKQYSTFLSIKLLVNSFERQHTINRNMLFQPFEFGIATWWLAHDYMILFDNNFIIPHLNPILIMYVHIHYTGNISYNDRLCTCFLTGGMPDKCHQFHCRLNAVCYWLIHCQYMLSLAAFLYMGV